MSTLKTDLMAGEFIKIGNGDVIVTLLEKSGRRARLEISTAHDMPIVRGSHESNPESQNALIPD